MYKFSLFLLFIVFLSCDTEVPYDDGDYESYIVANSIVSTDSTWKVRLTYSKSSFRRGDFDPVLGAEVSITVLWDDENGVEEIQKFNLEESGDGFYTRGSFPIQGRYYQLDIEKDDHELTAMTYVPKVLDAEIVEKRTILVNEEGEEEESYEFDVKLNTVDSESNYYAWDIIREEEETIKGEVIEYEEGTQSGGANPDDEGSGNTEPPKVSEKALSRNPSFTAVPFQNESGEVTLGANSVGGEMLTQIIQIAEGTSNPEEELQKYSLRVWAISYDYYQYLVSLQQNAPASSDVDFVNPYSNVENGGGIFAGYALAILPL